MSRAHWWLAGVGVFPFVLACSSSNGGGSGGGSAAFTDVTQSSSFQLVPLVVDGDGIGTAGKCADQLGVFSVYEAALRSYRYYRFCRADGTDVLTGVVPISYGTAIDEGRFTWSSGGQSNDTVVIAFYLDDDADGVADTARLHVECATDPPLGVVSTTTAFPATVGTQVCTTAGYEDFFPVKYYIASLSPLGFRVVVPDGSEHVLGMFELPGSAAVAKPATPTCGLSTCTQLQ